MQKRLVKLLMIVSIGGCIQMLLTSCATDSTPKPPKERISTIPQNRPEAWEGQSPFGGFGRGVR